LAAAGAALALLVTQPASASSISLKSLIGTAKQEWWLADPPHYAGAWDSTMGDGVVVAVIGDELDLKAPDLKGAYVRAQGFSPSVPALDTRPSSTVCYGTEVASLIAGRGHPASGGRDGTVGVAPHAMIMPIVVVPAADGLLTAADAVRSIDAAVAGGAKVIQFDFETHRDPRIDAAVGRALAQGAIVVSPVGDEGNVQHTFAPADIPGVFAVAGVQRSLESWDLSVPGPNVQVAAPATDMVVESPRKHYVAKSGTACAAALVSGEFADLWALHPNWTPAQIEKAVTSTADGHGRRLDDKVGYGVVDPSAAVRYAPPQARPSTAPPTSRAPAATAKAASSGSGTTVLTAVAAAAGLAVAVSAALLLVRRSRRGRRRYILPEPAPLLNLGPSDYEPEQGYPEARGYQYQYPTGYGAPEPEVQPEPSQYAYPEDPMFPPRGPVTFDEHGYTVYPPPEPEQPPAPPQ
jgi:hypothetical protein